MGAGDIEDGGSSPRFPHGCACCRNHVWLLPALSFLHRPSYVREAPARGPGIWRMDHPPPSIHHLHPHTHSLPPPPDDGGGQPRSHVAHSEGSMNKPLRRVKPTEEEQPR